jgi:hypothetical protein
MAIENKVRYEAAHYLFALTQYGHDETAKNILDWVSCGKRSACWRDMYSNAYYRGQTSTRALQEVDRALSEITDKWYVIIQSKDGIDILYSGLIDDDLNKKQLSTLYDSCKYKTHDELIKFYKRYEKQYSIA